MDSSEKTVREDDLDGEDNLNARALVVAMDSPESGYNGWTVGRMDEGQKGPFHFLDQQI